MDLFQRRVRSDLDTPLGTQVANIDGVGHDEDALFLNFLDDHIADHATVSSVIEIRDERKGDHDFLLVIGTVGFAGACGDDLIRHFLSDVFRLFHSGEIRLGVGHDQLAIRLAEAGERYDGSQSVGCFQTDFVVHERNEVTNGQDIARGVLPFLSSAFRNRLLRRGAGLRFRGGRG